jgi:hypothetical protein
MCVNHHIIAIVIFQQWDAYCLLTILLLALTVLNREGQVL